MAVRVGEEVTMIRMRGLSTKTYLLKNYLTQFHRHTRNGSYRSCQGHIRYLESLAVLFVNVASRHIAAFIPFWRWTFRV